MKIVLRKFYVNKEEVLAQSVRKAKTSITPKLMGIVDIAKNRLLKAFNQHPITQEIDAGPTASNSSGTLGGIGNLFSYIGFHSFDNPTEPIRNAIEDIHLEVIGSGMNIKYAIYYPNAEAIFTSYSPMPWATGRSWARGIERGIPGLAWYLFPSPSDNSRSGVAFQLENKLRGGKFQNTKYISALIKEFERQITTEIGRLGL